MTTFWCAAALVPAMAMMAASAMGQTAGAMKFREDWKATTQYFANEVVIGAGSELYIALQNTTAPTSNGPWRRCLVPGASLMLTRLHANATTTPNTRAYIQASAAGATGPAGPEGAALSVVDNAGAAVGILLANQVIVTTPDGPRRPRWNHAHVP